MKIILNVRFHYNNATSIKKLSFIFINHVHNFSLHNCGYNERKCKKKIVEANK